MNPADINAASRVDPNGSGAPPVVDDGNTVFRIAVSEKSVVRPVMEAILWISFGLILADLVFDFGKVIGNSSVRKIFSVTRPDALPNWFASLEMLAASGLTFFIGLILRKTGQSKIVVRNWWGLAAFLFVGAFDMGTGAHSVIGDDLHAYADDQMVGASEFLKPFYNMLGIYQWQVVLFPLYLIGGFCAFDFLRKTVNDKRLLQFIQGAASCFAFAYIFDHLVASWEADNLNRVWRMPIDQARHIAAVFQAAAKLVGGALILYFMSILLLNLTSVIATRKEELAGEPSAVDPDGGKNE